MGCLSACSFSLGDDGESSKSSSSSKKHNDEDDEEDEKESKMPTPPSPDGKDSAEDEKLLYVTGTQEQIAMRKSDEDSADVVAKLSLGDEVELISADSVTYYFVKSKADDVKGYVKKVFLTDEKSAVCKDEELFAEKQTSLFDTKKDDHKEIQKLNAGTSVTVLAKTSGDYWFVNVTNSKTYGYVKCMELSSSKPTSSSKAASSKSNKDNERKIGAGAAPTNYESYDASVASGYLAIRSAKAFDSSNELGAMNNGEQVYVVDKSTGLYWYCYSPKLGVYGYVNSDYLTTSTYKSQQQGNGTDYTVWTVSVAQGYLALRSAPAYNDANIKGKLYTGNVVYVYPDSYVNFSDEYWYVYSPSLNMWGYVNSNYIYS